MTLIFKVQTLEEQSRSENLFLNELGSGDGEAQKVVV